jgi:hypothetical protein
MHSEYYIPLKLTNDPRISIYEWPINRQPGVSGVWHSRWHSIIRPDVNAILESRGVNAWRATVFRAEGIKSYSPHIDGVTPGEMGCWGIHWHFGSPCILKWYESEEDKTDHAVNRLAWDAKNVIYETVVHSPCLIRINRAHSVHNIEDRERWAIRLTGTPDSWDDIKIRLQDLLISD